MKKESFKGHFESNRGIIVRRGGNEGGRRNAKNPKVTDQTIIIPPPRQELPPEPSQAISAWEKDLQDQITILNDYLRNNPHLSLVEQVPTKQRIGELQGQLKRVSVKNGGKIGRTAKTSS